MLPLGVFQIRELLLDDRSSPFGKWFSKLDHVSAVKVQVALARIEQGNVGSIKWFEGIGEIKIHWGAGLRIYVGKQTRRYKSGFDKRLQRNCGGPNSE